MIRPETTISINGKELSTFEKVYLSQAINDHHYFEVVLDQTAIEVQEAHTIEKSKEWLGKSIVISFGDTEFLGAITNIQLAQKDGYFGQIIVTGYSKSILLEGGQHMQSWLKKDLGKIVTEVIGEAGIPAEVSPVYTNEFEYQAQHNETHFQFLQRLAKQHNEWFFYDGQKLVFGKPNPGNPIELEYGKEISDVNISISATPSKQNIFSYNSLDDKKDESKTKDAVGGLNELGSYAFDVSKNLFPIVPNNFSDARVKDKSEIDSIIKNKQSSSAAESNMLTATSTKQGLTVGSVIKLSAGVVKDGELQNKKYGEYLITAIRHRATGIDSYSNDFQAISSGVEVLPEPNVGLPLAQPQAAAVISNDDPKKKGRVQVQFQWQTGDMKTSWLRVMTPDAGASDKVGTNRGFVFIPEVDDMVMVGFRYSDPNRPFVMGSMFSGTTGEGGDAGNKAKSITTRSGSTIVFDDDTNDGNITIIDAAQNIIMLDGKGVVSVTANDKIAFQVGKSGLVMDKDGKIQIIGETIQVKGEKEVTMVASKGESEGGSVSLNPKEAALTAPNDLIMSGKKTASLSSKTVTVGGDTEVNVAGGKVNLN